MFTTDFDEVVTIQDLVSVLPPLADQAYATFDTRRRIFASRLPSLLTTAQRSIDGIEGKGGSTAVSLLIDHSGSMRGEKINAAALAAASLAALAVRLGITLEILGYTTRGWKGGRSREAWLSAGQPAMPGRLCDLRHIIYLKAGDTLRDGALTPMLRDGMYHENIDGEAVEWAVSRLRSVTAQRRLLLVLSDGAPSDDSTNRQLARVFLERHLKDVVETIESSGDIAIRGVGIGKEQAVAKYYASATVVESADALPTAVVDEVTRWLGA